MEDDALAASAWAGYYAAKGDAVNSEKWAKAAKERAGKVVLHASGGASGQWVEVRVSGEYDLDLCDQLLEIVKLTRAGCERRTKQKEIVKAEASAAVESVVQVHDEVGA